MDQKKTMGRGMAVLLSAALVPTVGVPAAAFADEGDASQEQAAAGQEAFERVNVVDEMLAQDAAAPSQEGDGQVDGEPACALIGSVEYASLNDAFAAAVSGDTIELSADADVSQSASTPCVKEGVELTLDLNGHALKAANTATGHIEVLGGLTIVDSTDANKDGSGSGVIYTETAYTGGDTGYALVRAADGGSIVMESGRIDAASFTDDNAGKGQFAVGLNNKNAAASFTMNGGKIEAGWYAVSGNGTNRTYDGDITINGGELVSVADYAIYNPQKGTLAVNGGVVCGQAGGIALNAGDLVMSGGTVTSKGKGDTGDWGDGTGGLDNAAINVNAKYGDAAAKITGGTVIAEGDALALASGDAYHASIAVSGGTFSGPIDKGFCAPGYEPVQNQDGSYTVEIPEANRVAEISGAYYPSFNDAIAAAQNGDTVKLLQNADMTEIAVIDGKSIALDLNGQTVANSKDIWKGENWSLVSVRNGGELVVDGKGTMKAKENDCYVFDVQEGSKLTINDGTFVGNISVVYLYNKIDSSAGRNELVVNGGDFSIQQLSDDGNSDYRFMLNCYDSAYASGKAVVTVNGGVFHGFNPGDNHAEGEGTDFLGDGAAVTVDDQTVPPTYSVAVPSVTPPSKPDTDVEVEQKPDGSTVTTETKPDGSQTVTTETPDGTSSQVEKDADGNVTSTEVSVSDKAAAAGKVELPIEASTPAADAADAPAIEVKLPASVAPDAPVKVSVPVAKAEGAEANQAVVVMAIDAEGNETVLPKCAVDADGNVLFEATGDVTIKIVDASPSFPDIAGAWYDGDGTADFVGARGILTGMPQADGSLLFDGDAATTRAMFVTMLHRLESEAAPAGSEDFDDINGDWFADAAAWGHETGIVKGYNDEPVFGGDDAVTREQIAVFAMRYAQWLGLDTSARADLSDFVDADEVTPFVSDAMRWAVAEGILRGHADGSQRLDPLGGATRAEASAVAMRLVDAMYE